MEINEKAKKKFQKFAEKAFIAEPSATPEEIELLGKMIEEKKKELEEIEGQRK